MGDIWILFYTLLYIILLFIYKYYHNVIPCTFVNFFCVNNVIHSHYTRQYCSFHPPRFKSQLSKRFIRYKGSVLWNNIVTFIDVNVKISTFKTNLKKYILKVMISILYIFNVIILYQFTNIFLNTMLYKFSKRYLFYVQNLVLSDWNVKSLIPLGYIHPFGFQPFCSISSMKWCMVYVTYLRNIIKTIMRHHSVMNTWLDVYYLYDSKKVLYGV